MSLYSIITILTTKPIHTPRNQLRINKKFTFFTYYIVIFSQNTHYITFNEYYIVVLSVRFFLTPILQRINTNLTLKMKIITRTLLLGVIGLLSFFTQAQDIAPIPCEVESREAYLKENPKAQKEADELELMTRKFIISKRLKARNNAKSATSANRVGKKYIVPIVFHVFGTDFAGKKVDDALVKDALKKTNEDFNGLNNDYNDVSQAFRSLRETLDIEFRLADVDPNGNPTTGIMYYNTRSGFGADYKFDKEIAEFAWDNYKYFNVYIQLDLKKDGKLNRSGVAWYPNKGQSDEGTARAVFNGRYLGTNGDENFRRILTHEFGHYLNLAHTFDGGCSGTGDNVDDTPATTVSLQCLVTEESCSGAGIPNSENFMDYTDCYRMFTKGQVTRMEAALEHVTRKPLWQTANHANVFLQSSTQPRLFYDFTTFSESFENDGSIGGGRDVKIRLVDGPRFSSIGTLPSSSYTVENLPAGLAVQVISSSNTEAVVRLTGKANTHAKSNNLRNLKLTFNNGAFSNYSATNIKGYSRPDLRIEFNDAYLSTYISPDNLTQVAVDGDNFSSFGIYPGQQRPRYELSIENEQLKFGYDTGNKHVAVTADKKVLFIEEGTTIGANLNWDHDTTDRVLLNETYQAWKGKRGFVGLRIEREEFPGKYYYGWARLEVSADGKIVRFIDFYSHQSPNAVVKAGESDKPIIALSKPIFFEAEANNGTFTESIDVILEGSASFTSQNLVNGSHFTISNLPEGLSANIQKVNNKLAKLTLQGTANSHVRGDGALTKLTFSESAFTTAPGNRTDFNLQVRFFDPYGITYIDTANLFPLVNEQNKGQWFYLDTDFDFGDNARYAVNFYTDGGDSQNYIIINARGKGFTMNKTNYHAISLAQGTQVNASSPFVSSQWGVNHAPRFAGKNVASNGKTIYSGLRFRDRAGRLHYGWVQVRAEADGSGAQLLAASFNRKPNEGITVGQVENVHCYAGANMNEKFDDYSSAIGTFTFEQFSQKSDFPQNYTNFTSKTIKVRPGKNNFSIKDDGIKTSGTNIIGMWIDLNNDKDFEDAGEQIHMSQPYSAGSDYGAEVTLPNVNGTYTLRITMKNETEAADPKPAPCDFFLHGEVEDYTINISASNPIYPIAKFDMPESISAKGLVQVTDQSTREPDSWNWAFEGGVPATFNGKTPPSIYYENSGDYKVSLTVKKGNIEVSVDKTLKVNPHATEYCEATRRGTYANRNDVTKVVFGSISNTTPKGGTGYGDFTSQSTNLVEGQTYPIELTTYQQISNTTNDAATNLVVWIDWNRNNEFSLDEIAYERRAIGTDTPDMVLTSDITVPKIYSNGSSLMRIIRYYSYDKEDRPRCGEIVEADIEDYTVNLSGSGVIINPPVAQFTANSTTITKGESVSFTDQSTNTPTSWSWAFTGGTPITSTAQNPTVTYNTPGTYQVVLTATNAGGNNTETKTGYITVNDSNPNPDDTYCQSAGTRIQYEWIAEVQVGTFTNTTSATKYGDFTSKTIPLIVGEATSTILTPGYGSSVAKEYFKVWVDYDQNGTFDTNEVAFDSGTAKENAQTGAITVPASAKQGETRMRISMKYNGAPASPCGNIGDGSVQDYTVNIAGVVTNPPVAQFTANSTTITKGGSVSFTDQSTNTPTSWSWTFTGGTPATSTAQNPSVIYNTAGTYQVVLTATNAGGNNTETKTGYITVNDSNPNPDITYCESAGTRIQYEWISEVKVGSFTNTSTAIKYGDFTSKTIPLSVGIATSTTLTPGYASSVAKEYFKVWIDYDQNGTFDSNEVAFDSGTAKENAQTGTITVPASAKQGETRMRISMKYNGAPASPCGNIGDGSVQDYTVNISTATTPTIEYCESAGTRIQYEWIAEIKVGTFTNTSAAAKYSDFTSKTIPLSVGEATSTTLTPGYASSVAKEYFKVWIDYNQDGTFDSNEVAFDSGTAKENAQTGTITVPANAKQGQTRMRISMKYNGAPTSPCGNIGDGSVQDFTVNISNVAAKEGAKISGNDMIVVHPNPAKDIVNISFIHSDTVNDSNKVITLRDITGKVIREITAKNGALTTQFNVKDLNSGTYIISIRTNGNIEHKRFLKN